jgi:integrase
MKVKQNSPTARTFKEIAAREIDDKINSQRLRHPDSLRHALAILLKALGSRADSDPKDLRPEHFVGVRLALAEGGFARITCCLVAKILQMVIPYGLDPSCLKALRDLPTGPAMREVQPVRNNVLKIILKALVDQIESVQILIWLALSGMPYLLDAVLLRFVSIEWSTGLIRVRRHKTGVTLEFGALPPLLDLLKRRQERLGPDAVYVFPEFIFSKAELLDPRCNREPSEEPSRQIGAPALHRARQVITEFLDRCNVGRHCHFRALARHMLSFWTSIGISFKTRMQSFGQAAESAHNRLELATEFEIVRARDIAWNYIQAIQEDRPFVAPSTHYEVYEMLVKHWERVLPELLRGSVHNEVRCSVAEQQNAMVEALTQQLLKFDRTVEGLKTAVEELRSQVQSKAAA